MAIIRAYEGIKPQIAADVFVAENAAIIGDVTIGARSSVWYGAVIRGDHAPITVGAGTSIQDNVTLHCDEGHALTVGDNVTVGHNAVVHCTSVGDNTLIGMGARLLDGAVIGKNCIIGSGAVVKENDVVPDGTLMVGVPAKAVRACTPEQLDALQQTSPYVALSRNYLK